VAAGLSQRLPPRLVRVSGHSCERSAGWALGATARVVLSRLGVASGDGTV
jgi:hypothetical protein